MEIPEVKVSLNGEGEATLRIGEAAPVEVRKKISLSGNINSPAEWFNKRAKDLLDEKQHLASHVVVTVSDASARVTLVENDLDPKPTEITGVLELNPDFSRFKINATDRWGIKELAQFLRVRGHFFTMPEDRVKILAALTNFKAKIDVEIEKAHSTKGDKKDLVEVRVQQDVPPAFRLTMPIFKGASPVTFYVEFGFEYTDSGVRLFIFSDEIEGLIYTDRTKILEEAVQPMKDAGLPIIWNG